MDSGLKPMKSCPTMSTYWSLPALSISFPNLSKSSKASLPASYSCATLNLKNPFGAVTCGIPATLWLQSASKQNPLSGATLPVRKVHKAWQLRLQPTLKQKQQLSKTFGCSRYVYNHFLARRKEEWEMEQKTLRYADCSQELTALKQQPETAWLKEVDKFALQNALRDLDGAYQHFFRGLKSGKRVGYPRFKSRKGKQSYRSNFTNGNIAVEGHHLKLPKLGWVKFRKSLEIEGKILSVTLKRSPSGKYFASIVTEVETHSWEKTGKALGLDWGLAHYLTTSAGEKFPNPRYWKHYIAQLKKLHKILSRKALNSKNREKARAKLARLYEKLFNVRTDWLHKLSTGLLKAYDWLCLEDIRLANLVRNKKLSKWILDSAWGTFVQMLFYKAERYGKEVIKVAPFFPSSQRCHACHFIHREVKDLKVRQWECPQCHMSHDRDVNAALNILQEGLRLLSESYAVAVGMPDTLNACGDGVRPGLSWATVEESGIMRLLVV